MTLYLPQKKIVIASSFEGVVNNGAKECGVVSLAAYRKMVKEGQIKDSDALLKHSESKIMSTFLALRPLVAVAEDYLTVLQMIGRLYPYQTVRLIEGRDLKIVKFVGEMFEDFKSQTAKERALFKTEFYAERKNRQESNYKAWLNLQEPFSETIGQFRLLNELKTFDEKTVAQTGGFKLYYVTSKDEASTYQLCTVYGEFGRFQPGEVSDSIFTPGENYAALFESMKTCLIRRDCIIGKETVENVDKLVQMKMVAEKENVTPADVWRLQDRYDKGEFETLKAAGFVHQFVVTGGYAFPTDYAKAREDGIVVVERGLLAQSLSGYARENGF